MIKFFRHIRKAHMENNKTTRYFKYAIGEIILVVIGILIALQINNWNEERKAKIVETKVVKRLIADVKADSIFYNSRLELFSNQILTYNKLFDLCSRTETIPEDSIILKDYEKLFIKAANYSNVINNEADIMEQISNDSIKQALRNYYKSFRFITIAIEISNTDIREFGNVFDVKHAKMSQINKPMSILDYRDYCELENLEGYLKILIRGNQNSYQQTVRFLKDNTQLKLKLTQYLKELQ
jgi:translation initiation factor 2 beta subunit (eIF-2beta)/eIF-5